MAINQEINSLISKYEKLWGTTPIKSDYIASREQFLQALRTCVKKKIKLEDILQKKDGSINNQNLINSLKNDTSNQQNVLDAQNKQHDKQNKKATENINIIKHGGVQPSQAYGERIVDQVNEIRTVQSNKNLKKTRRAIIVRENRENLPRTILARTLNLLSFALVGVLAVFFGMFAGNMYVASKTLVNYNYNEADYIADYQTIYSLNSTSSPTQVHAADAYDMAEYQLFNSSGLIDHYTITGNGYVKAKVSAIEQRQTIIKSVQKTKDGIVNQSVTDGLIPAAEKLQLNFATGIMDSYITKSVNGNPPAGNYNSTPTKSYNLNAESDFANFRKEYGINPNSVLPYLVSRKTVEKASEATAVDGGYQYTIKLHNIYGVINYVYYMMHISGLKRPPTFYDLEITFTVDSNFRFKELYVYESYQIYYMGLPSECTAETTYLFSYD